MVSSRTEKYNYLFKRENCTSVFPRESVAGGDSPLQSLKSSEKNWYYAPCNNAFGRGSIRSLAAQWGIMSAGTLSSEEKLFYSKGFEVTRRGGNEVSDSFKQNDVVAGSFP